MINLFDLYAMVLYSEIERKISQFLKYFLEYNDQLDATVRSTKFRRSTLPQGGLEIPIKLPVGKGKASLEIFRKMKGFMVLCLIKSRQNPVGCKDRRRRGRDKFFVTFQVFRLISLENNHIRIFKCNTIFNLDPL